MLDVCLLGCGGMMPLPRRWLTALMLRYNGSSILIDCGEGTQIAIKEKGWSFKPIDVICFTHYHGDHISGLPGLLLSMGNAERHEPLTLIGPKGLERVVNALRTIAPELPFEIYYKEIQGTEETFEMNGYRIRAFRVNHNVLCYGYTMEIDRAGKFDVERAKAANIPLCCWNPLQKGNVVEFEGVHYTPDMVLGQPHLQCGPHPERPQPQGCIGPEGHHQGGGRRLLAQPRRAGLSRPRHQRDRHRKWPGHQEGKAPAPQASGQHRAVQEPPLHLLHRGRVRPDLRAQLQRQVSLHLL